MQRTWRTFLGQLALIGAYETANELLRTVVASYGGPIGIEHGRQVVSIERALGFWVEPRWQLFFRAGPRLAGLSVPWSRTRLAFDFIYSLGHLCFTILFMLWLFYFRTAIFGLIRNILFAADALALLTYWLYPLAPPRLTPGLRYDGHPFSFVDTLLYWPGGKGRPNEYAAMPSIHMCYSLIVGLTLALTLRRLPFRLLALLYPVLMLVTVVVTANHYLMDAVGAVGVLALAAPFALMLRWLRRGRCPWRELTADFRPLPAGNAPRSPLVWDQAAASGADAARNRGTAGRGTRRAPPVP